MVPPYEICDIVEGRRRVWPMGKVEDTEAMNYGIQTLGASIMNRGMRNCNRYVLPRFKRQALGIAQIHDAAVFKVREDQAAKFAEALKPAFEQSYERDGRTIFFNIDVKIGDDWSQV
jgi:DNA polymerase I-like protein with 3'-5' exonuclease and polymerase domains